MKTSMKLFLGLILMSFTLQGFAQKPEPVYSVARQMYDFDWYEQQAKAWKQEIDNGTTNNMSWVYWFRASRIARVYSDPLKWKSKEGNYFISQDKIIKLAEKSIPNSFEYYFLKASIDDVEYELVEENIMKAQALKPFDKLLLPQLVNYYQITNDKPNLELSCKKWFDCNEIPQELLITAYNNLISLEPNAILIVNADNDTYPAWVLQYSQKIRLDVLVLNLDLAVDRDKYREMIFKENGISPIIFKNKNDSTFDPKAQILSHIVNTINRPIYISTYSSFEEYRDFKDKVYFVGLSLKYSEKPFDNLAVIRNNVENKYLLDFLKHSFYKNYAQVVVNQMNNNYIAVFLKLYEHYLTSGETKKAQDIKALAKTIAENGGSKKWMKYFEK